MKTTILCLSLLCSLATNAMTIEETVDELTGDVSALIKNPAHGGSNLPFTAVHNNSENGVCRALGYEKAAISSSRTGDKGYSIAVNEKGLVVSGPYDYTMKQIVCLNKTGMLPNELSVLVINPRHESSSLQFSYYSSSSGVCKSLGYQRAAAGSTVTAEQSNTIKVDNDGNVVAGPYDWNVERIVCIKPRN